MTERTYIAAALMQGLLANGGSTGVNAADAVLFADALLAELAK